jgi:UDP-N-acetylmuramate dehydrogenase
LATTTALLEDVPLAPLTTLELGGRARYLLEARDDATVVEGARWATERRLPLLVLGGGSNLIVPDAGFDGLVIKMASRGIDFEADGTSPSSLSSSLSILRAQAGEPWDALVAETVRRGLAGLECLSGIPGLAGATPIQNVGAYGQEVAETIRSVRALDRRTFEIVELPPDRCAFAYRDSAFKKTPDRWIVLGVTFALRPGGPATVRYDELERALAAGGLAAPSLDDVRRQVLRLRRGKSMVLDPDDPNRRSVGSFFTNPIVDATVADRLVDRLVAEGVARDRAAVPRFAAGPDRVKLSAAWLIERAGITKGLRDGAVGVSSRHALALVHHGGGTTAELLALARRVRDAVAARFGIDLSPEPVIVDGPSGAPVGPGHAL